jgi:nitrogen-specific signal transduction histidine kinase
MTKKGSEIQNIRFRILGKLSSGLIHEIRNPLAVIKMNLDYLRRSKKIFSREISESLESCSEAADKLLLLADNFSALSRNERQGLNICSLNDAATTAVNVLRTIAGQSGIKINTNLQPNLPPVSFQKDKLLLVILYLLNYLIETVISGTQINLRTYQGKINSKENIFFEIELNAAEHKSHSKKIFEIIKKDESDSVKFCKNLLKEFDARISFSKKHADLYFNIRLNTTNK